MVNGAHMGFTQDADDIVRQELAVEDQQGIAVAFILMKEFLELPQEFGEVRTEPIAAALSYGFGRLDGSVDVGKNGPRETVLVYDLGGGTFDATVIELADRRISVLAVEGDHQLGGADWDERIALYLSQQFCATNPDAEDPLDDSAGSQMLVLAAERAKRELTDVDRTDVVVAHDRARAVISLTRDEVEAMTASLMRRTIDLTRDCLAAAAKRGVSSVDRLLLVGGSSRMPMVERELRKELGLAGELRDPDLSVARGAATPVWATSSLPA